MRLILPVFLTSALAARTNIHLLSNGTHQQILCPVISALYHGKDLNTDANGNVEIIDIYNALHKKLKVGHLLSAFQAYGIVGYEKSQKNIQEHRNRCLPGTWCHTRREVFGVVNDGTKRYLNVFMMHGTQVIEHGISTGVRGGDTNMPPDAVNCRGTYPCSARFKQFFGDEATKKFYLKDILSIVCKARKIGDRGGEFAYASSNKIPGYGNLGPVPLREWQMKGAMSAMLLAFGRIDKAGEYYMTMDDMKAMMLEGRYPDGWKPTANSCLFMGAGCKQSAVEQFNLDFECDVGYDEPFWQGTGCNTYTGQTCGIGKECAKGSTCISSKCICSRGSNYKTMCFKNGKCQHSPTTWRDEYFGYKNHVYRADNPEARGNP